MSISTFFSMSALKPGDFTYDPNAPETAPFSDAYLNTYGGISGSYFPLTSQYNSDSIFLGYDPVPPGTPLFSDGDDPTRHSGIRIYFGGHNVTDQNQYLLLFQLRGKGGTPSAEFFVGDSLVDTLALPFNQSVQHAILLDCPGDNFYVSIYVRLASYSSFSNMSFEGVDCYLL